MFAAVHIGAIWHKTAELIASAHRRESVRHCIGEKLPLSARSNIIPLFVALQLFTHWHCLILYYVEFEEELGVKGYLLSLT